MIPTQIICSDKLLYAALCKSLRLLLDKTDYSHIKIVKPLISDADVNIPEFYFSQAMKYVCDTRENRCAIVVGIDKKDTCGALNCCRRLSKTVICIPHPVILTELLSVLYGYEQELPQCTQKCSIFESGDFQIYAEKKLNEACHVIIKNLYPEYMSAKAAVDIFCMGYIIFMTLFQLFIPSWEKKRIQAVKKSLKVVNAVAKENQIEEFQEKYLSLRKDRDLLAGFPYTGYPHKKGGKQ